MPDYDLLTIPEAALVLGRSGPTIRRYIAQGYLPVVQIGGPGQHPGGGTEAGFRRDRRGGHPATSTHPQDAPEGVK